MAHDLIFPVSAAARQSGALTGGAELTDGQSGLVLGGDPNISLFCGRDRGLRICTEGNSLDVSKALN